MKIKIKKMIRRKSKSKKSSVRL